MMDPNNKATNVNIAPTNEAEASSWLTVVEVQFEIINEQFVDGSRSKLFSTLAEYESWLARVSGARSYLSSRKKALEKYIARCQGVPVHELREATERDSKILAWKLIYDAYPNMSPEHQARAEAMIPPDWRDAHGKKREGAK